jgi:hypothetical protein
MLSDETIENKMLSDETKYIDLLDEDSPIAGFKFVGLSFVSPEKILKKRELYLFEHFVKEWDFTKSMYKFNDFLHFLSHKYTLPIDDLLNDYNEFINEESINLKTTTFEDDYKNFLDKNENRLNEKFNKEHNFQTSVRGLKIRCYGSTLEEVGVKCKRIREKDPYHDILVGPVGIWIPWDPELNNVNYMEEELNQLHSEKIKNEEKAKDLFEQRIRDTKRKAIEENVKKAQQFGNVLTQKIDENDNLIGVNNLDFSDREVSNSNK